MPLETSASLRYACYTVYTGRVELTIVSLGGNLGDPLHIDNDSIYCTNSMDKVNKVEKVKKKILIL